MKQPNQLTTFPNAPQKGPEIPQDLAGLFQEVTYVTSLASLSGKLYVRVGWDELTGHGILIAQIFGDSHI